MTKVPSPKDVDLVRAVKASIDNGYRLLEETDDLEFRSPPATRYFMAMIAQEEFAKAFLLYLVKERIAPFNAGVRRALNDHSCKQLTGMIMDYMIMHWDEIEGLQAAIRSDYEHGDRLPNEVGSALEILCYEKIENWTGRNWVWGEAPAYDQNALRVAEGSKDRRKQDALYVRIGRTGQVASTPGTITDSETEAEISRAGRYGQFAQSIDGRRSGSFDQRRFDRVMAAANHGLIVDDPVSSLDHLRIRRVARRLAAEAAKGKQVIVFTHNLLFYNEMADAAAAHNPAVPVARRLISKTAADGFGVVTNDEEPWAGKKTTLRIEALKDRRNKIAAEHADFSTDAYRAVAKDFYTDLRETWERFVEEVLLGKTVERFNSEVKTQSLKNVVVEDSDYKTIYGAMKRVSERSGHDMAAGKNVPAPTPDDMKADLDELRPSVFRLPSAEGIKRRFARLWRKRPRLRCLARFACAYQLM